MRSRPHRLGRALPDRIERDLFEPALADLRSEFLAASRPLGIAFAIRVALMWLDCWRLWVVERMVSRRRTGAARTHVPGREYRAMFVQDVRRAFRLFRLEPGFAAAAVLTLTLGIGANTALFAVVEALLVRPLPVPGAEEVMILKYRDLSSGITKEFLGIGDVFDMRTRLRTLEQVGVYGNTQLTLFEGDEPVRLAGVGATPEFLAALRLQPALGRLISADDVREGAPPVVMISHELWETQLGSDPNILSRSIRVGVARRQVIGVIPRGFQFPPTTPAQVMIPYTLPAAAPSNRQSGWLLALGRLRPGETADTARAELASLSSEFARDYPDQNAGIQYYVEPLRDAVMGDTKRPLLLLLTAVGFVLLIACVNVGNLLLARSLGRRQEMAVRMALGAARSRLASQVLIEGFVLALAGGVAGVIVAWQLAPALAAMVPEASRIPALRDVGINVPVVIFTLAMSIVSALLFGAIACLSLTQNEQRSALAVARGTSMSGHARWAASVLVGAEIALAGVLLVGAGLTLRSFANLIAVDPGFRSANVLTAQLSVPVARYRNQQSRAEFYTRAMNAITAVPGVERAGLAVVTPLTGNNWTVPFERVDRPGAAGERPPLVGWQAATAGYFEALGIPLRDGRLFAEADVTAKITPVIVSESIAREYFQGESAVGHRLRGGNGEFEIVGVVGDIRRAALSDRLSADMYFPFADSSATLFVSTTGDPLQSLASIRSALRGLEPNLVLERPRTMADVASASTAVTQLAMRLLAGFAVVALTLAAVGIYAVMAHNVRRRSRELGTRVALGASRGDIVRLVMREGSAITIAGLVAGVASAVFAARWLGAVLYNVATTDPVALAAAAAVLAITALAACYLPARRAAAVDPARTLTIE